jgi:hypothetical protein
MAASASGFFGSSTRASVFASIDSRTKIINISHDRGCPSRTI